MIARLTSPAMHAGLRAGLQVLLVLALLGVLQAIAARHNHRFDLTPERRLELGRASRQAAAGVNRLTRLTAFYDGRDPDARRDIADVLAQFARAATPHLQYSLHDLDRSPGLAQKLGVARYNAGVLESGDEVVNLHNLDEADIAAALLQLSGARPRTVCFVTGHGERSPIADGPAGYSEVAAALGRARFDVVALGTVTGEGVPATCTVVVLAGPSKELLPGEAEALTTHVRVGGRALIMVDLDAPDSVIALLRELGIAVGDAVIVDEENRFVGADAFMPQITAVDGAFLGQIEAPGVLVLARPVMPADRTATGMEVRALGTSTPESWARVGAATGDPARFRPGLDERGPVPVAAMSVLEARADGGRRGAVLAIGDSDFGSNAYVGLLGNRDLALSAVAALASDPAPLAVNERLQPRGAVSPIALTAAQSRRVFAAAVIAAPLTCVLIGAAVGALRLRRCGGR
ncbi:MAG: Gldg family protein [Candidatus Binatia bacterium]